MKLTMVTNTDEGGSGMEFSELGGSRCFRATIVASAGLSECERERGRQQGERGWAWLHFIEAGRRETLPRRATWARSDDCGLTHAVLEVGDGADTRSRAVSCRERKGRAMVGRAMLGRAKQ